MAVTSSVIEVLPSLLGRMAKHVKEFYDQSELTQEELARRYNEAAESLFPAQELQRMKEAKKKSWSLMSRDRVADLLQAAQPRPGAGRARVLLRHEPIVWAHLLGVSQEQLLGAHYEGIIYWDPLTQKDRGHHLFGLLKEHESLATELLGWASFLPCSLETEAFMKGHHEGLFRSDIHQMQPEYATAAIAMYNSMGMARREHVLGSGPERPWRFTHLMVRSDLEDIARGRGPYQAISRDVRRDCLTNLKQLVSDASMKIDLVIAEEGQNLHHVFHGVDNLCVFDETFAWWRNPVGDVAFTAHHTIVMGRRATLEGFRLNAAHRTREAAVALLNDLLGSTH